MAVKRNTKRLEAGQGAFCVLACREWIEENARGARSNFVLFTRICTLAALKRVRTHDTQWSTWEFGRRRGLNDGRSAAGRVRRQSPTGNAFGEPAREDDEPRACFEIALARVLMLIKKRVCNGYFGDYDLKGKKK